MFPGEIGSLQPETSYAVARTIGREGDGAALARVTHRLKHNRASSDSGGVARHDGEVQDGGRQQV